MNKDKKEAFAIMQDGNIVMFWEGTGKFMMEHKRPKNLPPPPPVDFKNMYQERKESIPKQSRKESQLDHDSIAAILSHDENKKHLSTEYLNHLKKCLMLLKERLGMNKSETLPRSLFEELAEEDELKSLDEARIAGDVFYTSGRPCKRGHTSKRSTKGRHCIECRDVTNKSYYEKNKEKVHGIFYTRYHTDEKFRLKQIEYVRDWQDRNPDKVAEYARRRRAKR